MLPHESFIYVYDVESCVRVALRVFHLRVRRILRNVALAVLYALMRAEAGRYSIIGGSNIYQGIMK